MNRCLGSIIKIIDGKPDYSTRCSCRTDTYYCVHHSWQKNHKTVISGVLNYFYDEINNTDS